MATLDPVLKASMAQTVYVAAVSSIGSDLTPVYAAAASRIAKVELEDRVVEQANGSMRATTHVLILDAADGDVSLTDRIWLPGDGSTDVAKARHPAQRIKSPEEDGTATHLEVLL